MNKKNQKKLPLSYNLLPPLPHLLPPLLPLPQQLHNLHNLFFVSPLTGAIALDDEILNVLDGVVDAFYPGPHGAQAIADVLFGEYSPSGRSPITFYKSTSNKDLFVSNTLSSSSEVVTLKTQLDSAADELRKVVEEYIMLEDDFNAKVEEKVQEERRVIMTLKERLEVVKLFGSFGADCIACCAATNAGSVRAAATVSSSLMMLKLRS